MATRGPPTLVAPQGVVTKPGLLPYAEIGKRQSVDPRIHLYPIPSNSDGVFKMNKGEPLLAFRDAIAVADAIETFSSLNGIYVDDYEFQLFRQQMLDPNMDEFEARREFLYTKLRCLGVVQNDTSFSLMNPQTNGPGVTIQKAGTVSFKWLQKEAAQEGQWVVWKLPDLLPSYNPQVRNPAEDNGRVIAELVPLETTSIFPNRDNFIRLLGLDREIRGPHTPRRRGHFEHGYDLAYEFERMVLLIAYKSIMAWESRDNNVPDKPAIFDFLQGDQHVNGNFGQGYDGANAFKAILKSILKPSRADVGNSAMKRLEMNGATEFFVGCKAHACKTFDRIVGQITKGGHQNGIVDAIVAKLPLN